MHSSAPEYCAEGSNPENMYIVHLHSQERSTPGAFRNKLHLLNDSKMVQDFSMILMNGWHQIWKADLNHTAHRHMLKTTWKYLKNYTRTYRHVWNVYLILTEFLKNFMTISSQKIFATVVCFSIHVVFGMERQNSKTRQWVWIHSVPNKEKSYSKWLQQKEKLPNI